MTFGSTFGRTFSPTFQPKSQAAASAGGTVTVGAAADTWLNNASPYTYNYGAAASVGINTPNVRKALFRFNLSAIPASATCTAASLTITAASKIWPGSTRTFSIYEVASANGDWVEGTGNGSAVTGAPCWNYKAYHASTPTSWAGSNGMSTAGTDYIDTALATYTVYPSAVEINNSFDFVFNASGRAVVKSWFGQATNSGIVAWYNCGTSVSWHTKEASTESYRPTLTVTYA